MEAGANEDVLIEIEEIDSNDVPENELEQFQETEPLQVLEFIVSEGDNDALKRQAAEEGALIRRYVQGEGEFPEFCTKLEPGDEDDEDIEEVQSEAATMVEEDNRICGDDNDDDFEQRHPVASTSTAAAEKRAARQQSTSPQKDHTEQPSGIGESSGNFGRRSALSPTLLGLMGEANLSFAYGRYDTAEKICMEIIRQNPLASEPFYTLAEIYENRDDVKFLQFSTIAAHLNPQDRDLWIRISDMLVQQGQLSRARIYYTKAIKVLHKDYLLRLRKAQLLERMGEGHTAMFTYLKMLPLMPPSEWALCLSTARNVASFFHLQQKHALALEAMNGAYSVCGSRFSLGDLNIFLELLILNKQYKKVLQCLREHTDLDLEAGDNLEVIHFCKIPNDYLPDLRAKLCVSLIHMRAHHLLGYIVQNVHTHITLTVDRVELYMDITEALMQEHKYAEAISLMRPITDDDTFECPAFVWLRQAECLRQLNRTNEAIQCYERVVQLAPFCYEAKFTLSALLKQQGKHEEAVKALEQPGEGENEGQPLHARLLYERCVMLQQIGRIEEFLEVGYVLLGRHSIKLRNREELVAASNSGNAYNTEGLKAIIQMRNMAESATGGVEREVQETLKSQNAAAANENSDLTIKMEIDLFLELVRIGHEHGMHSAVERIAFAMVTTKRFLSYHQEVERVMILACYFNNDCSIAFSYLRELISKHVGNINHWNLLSLLVQRGEDMRYFRYARRFAQRNPLAMQQNRIFLGHYHLNCSSYKYALNIYVPMLHEQPQAVVALCIAVVFNQLALQKKVLRKTAAVAQSIAFAHRYAELRNGGNTTSCTQQEIYYNIGRIYHQANLLNLAMDYYERALAVQHPLLEEHKSTLGLQHEIAFNLHLIYRANGNKQKARQYLMRYCVV
ncbi:general transcription factor 3C polypeptide 3 [Scaptodrosophila lebanonensis]|uniref:General transcription factor 3C polypeptide 3 n=1 Tax=Drosophila lebanonensis TaxID=7225 RepID=A0A6J2UJC1_DROLE|nr:general transcription factor 3C polypeptide 3 [Scaptodrosophila lebanonensis]